MLFGHISNVFDDVIVMEFVWWSKAAVVDDGGFSRGCDVIATTCDDDSEADDENEAGGNCE